MKLQLNSILSLTAILSLGNRSDSLLDRVFVLQLVSRTEVLQETTDYSRNFRSSRKPISMFRNTQFILIIR
jgi:hypothetical protein